MRPLLVDLGREYRGGQDQAFLLLRGLLARGHAPVLVTIRESLLARRAQAARVSVHAVNGRWLRLAAARVIRKLLASCNVDLVHANEPHALTAAWLAGAHRRVPVIASRRVIFPLAQSAVSLARYRAAARIVAVSQCVASAVAGSGLPQDKIVVIPDGVPIPEPISLEERREARRRLGIDEDAQIVGCVAALTPDKGQDILIRALPSVRAQFPRCHLLLAGDGPCRAKLGALSRELEVDDAVHFAGFVEEVQGVYAAVDVFAFPAQAEALGTALLSAMAHAVPVVTIARGGIAEVVAAGKNGLLLNDPEPNAFASAITHLFAYRDEANRLGRAARETIVARFSVDRMVDETLRLYEGLVTHGQ